MMIKETVPTGAQEDKPTKSLGMSRKVIEAMINSPKTPEHLKRAWKKKLEMM